MLTEEFLRESFRNREESHRSEETSYSNSMSTKVLTKEDKEKLREIAEGLSDRNAVLINSNIEVIRELPLSKLPYFRARDVFVILADTANSMVLSAAENYNAKYIAAKNFNKVESDKIEFISL